MREEKGKVYLVGAGPGDIGLLTVKGMKCLQKAEVVVYDFHLNAQVLNYINHDADFIYAGKRGGHHTLTQDEINELLVKKAKEGKRICRLKGGDPFIFGRGGEEAEVLAKNGIAFEVVPGVSSAVAAPAYAGIPLTHRLYSSSFAVIPGYEDTTKQGSSIDWARLSTGVGTLVVLMAVKNLDLLVQRLIENGKNPETPVAVVRWGTRADQRTVVSTLRDIVSEIKDKEIKPPAVCVIGEVVRLRDSLKWFENMPMFGHRVLVTREHSSGFEPLEELGAEIIEFPTIEIVPPNSFKEIDAAIRNIQTYSWIIFTSANGVRYFLKRFLERDRDIRDLKGIKICAIGTKTASEINKYGMRVDLVPDEFRAEGLIKAFARVEGQKSTSGSLKGLKFLLPRAEVAREAFPQRVRELGGEIDVPVVYRAVKPELHGKRLKRFLKEGRITIATFTSAATFNNFVEIMGSDALELLKDVTIAVIGPVTAKAIEQAGLKVEIIPKESTIEALVSDIIRAKAQEKIGSELGHFSCYSENKAQ
ncbi:MAG TPA: uroporphyrinogen-III C-methyltransferase [Thermodesulfovibrionales bacterium]|nr:uroporphyrinogen-III C-methyltransferase [Thermodesulfovibrionales bacterium]